MFEGGECGELKISQIPGEKDERSGDFNLLPGLSPSGVPRFEYLNLLILIKQYMQTSQTSL
jgi:hypothetical protein